MNRSSRTSIAIHILIVLAASWLVYFNAIDNDFTNWDDPEVVVNNPHIRSLSPGNIARILTPSQAGTSGIQGVYRPAWTLTYAVDYQIGGLDPTIYHVRNILLHSLNAALVYILAIAIGLAAFPALLAALLFAVHPIHVEAVSWVSGRNEMLLAFFFLIAFLLAVYRARLADGFRPWGYTLSVVVLALALLSKVTAAVFPLFVLGAYLWFAEPRREEPRCSRVCLLRHIPYLILSVAIVLIELFVSRASVVVRPESSESRTVTLLTVPKLILTYLGSLILPTGLSPRYDTSYVTGAAEVLVTVLGLALVVAATVWLGRRSRAFGLAALLFALTLLPASNIVLLSTLRADRFLYLPSVGFCLAAGVLLQSVSSPERPRWLGRRIVPALFAVVLLVFGGLTVRQNRVWQNSLSLWEHAVSCAPGDYMAHHNLGAVHFEQGRRGEAMLELETSIALNANFAKAHNNLGQVYASAGRWTDAEARFRRATDLDPQYAGAYANLGQLYAQTERYDEAARALERAIAIGLRPQRRAQAEALLRSLSQER